jgi:hypothetical protein
MRVNSGELASLKLLIRWYSCSVGFGGGFLIGAAFIDRGVALNGDRPDGCIKRCDLGQLCPRCEDPKVSSRCTWGRTLPSREASRPLYLAAAVVMELPSFCRSGTRAPRRR